MKYLEDDGQQLINTFSAFIRKDEILNTGKIKIAILIWLFLY